MEGRRAPTPARMPTMRRISLRSFFVGVTLLCVALGWNISSAGRQRIARQELERLGASVMFEHQWRFSGNSRSLMSRLLEPLATEIDPDFLLPVTVVKTRYIEDPSLKAGAEYTSSDVIAPVSRLPKIKRLYLSHSDVTNEDVSRLAHLANLEHLDLSMSKIREGAIPGLDQLRIKSLQLNRTRANDESIVTLDAIKTLEHIDLTRTKVTDAGLKYISNLPNLKKLILRRSLVTQEGYQHFKKNHTNVEVSWEPLN